MTRHHRPIIAITSACLLLGAGALTSLRAESDDDARYSMSQTDDGFLRLDRSSGQVSHCRKQSGDWACESVAEERTAYEAEIARLTEENERLRAGQAGSTTDSPDGLPTDEEIDKAFSLFERMTKRLARITRIFRDEVESLEDELESGNGS